MLLIFIKNIKYTKKQENAMHNEERRHSIKTNSKLTRMNDIVDKDSKSHYNITIIHMFHRLIQHMEYIN